MGADADGFGIVREAFHQGVKLRHDLKKCKQETFFRFARWLESKLRTENMEGVKFAACVIVWWLFHGSLFGVFNKAKTNQIGTVIIPYFEPS